MNAPAATLPSAAAESGDTRVQRGALTPFIDAVAPAPSRSSGHAHLPAGRIVEEARAYIQEHACEGLSVDQVLEHVAVSRSFLEKKFREYLRRSPHAEIRRVQLARICELLERTDYPIKCITGMTGFRYMEHLCLAFKRAMGETPGAYRARSRWPAAGR